jgi:hypothetical protein
MRRVAALAMLLCEMCFGIEVVSFQVPASRPVWLPTKALPAGQLVAPIATPWQYWVSMAPHELPPMPPKNPFR